MSPYTLPDGNVAIAFSGGRTSAYTLHQILEANGYNVTVHRVTKSRVADWKHEQEQSE